MIIKKLLLYSFILVLPVQMITSLRDTTETNFTVTGGYGQYANVSRGCSGNVLSKEKVPFSEIGLSIDHKTKTPFRLGICANRILTRNANDDSSHEIIAVNPFINLESKGFALGMGYFMTNRTIKGQHYDSGLHTYSGYLRIGNIRKIYFDASIFHTMPLFSGSCYKLGVGAGQDSPFGIWFGFGGTPQDKLGLIVRTDIRLRQDLYFNALMRIGSSEGISENAAGLGLKYKLIGSQLE
jgi:hypothetical protein